MKEMNFLENRNEESLSFILKQTEKQLLELNEAISGIRNYSKFVFIFSTTSLSFSFFRLVNKEYIYSIFFLGSLISICFITKNLYANYYAFLGANPEKFAHSWFESPKTMYKRHIIAMIKGYKHKIDKTYPYVKSFGKNYNNSIYSILITFFLFAFFYFIQNTFW